MKGSRQHSYIDIRSTLPIAALGRLAVDIAESTASKGWDIDYLGPDGTRLWFGVRKLAFGRTHESVMRFFLDVAADPRGVRARSQIEQFVRVSASSDAVVPTGPKQLQGYPTYASYIHELQREVLVADPSALVTVECRPQSTAGWPNLFGRNRPPQSR